MTRFFGKQSFRLPLLSLTQRIGGFFFLATALAVAALFSIAWTSSGKTTSEPADAVEVLYQTRVRDFQKRAAAFRNTVGILPKTPSGTALLRREVGRMRDAYKGFEFIVEHVHPGTAARMNAPPLDRADMTSPDAMDILAPEGLQVLLEAAHGEDPWADREHLLWLALRLELAARELTEKASTVTLDDRLVFEALQSQVLRVMTLGITGFDAPAVERALPESRLSLEAMRPVIDLYAGDLRRREPALARRLNAALGKSLARLSGQNGIAAFENFDRMAFMREAGNPLYAALIDAHHALGITTFADLDPLRRPISVTARNLFAPDFLDAHFYANTPGERPDSAGAALGRRLFFDPVLSSEGQQSCASCHDPRRGFSDGQPKSPGFGGGTLLRNAPGLTHAAYQSAQFWDLRARTLEEQINHVVHGEQEFNSSFLAVMGRLENHPEYRNLFNAVFGEGRAEGSPVTVGAMTKSLAMYLRSLNNWNSPFDRYMRGETEFLDPAAKRGFNLFAGKALCATCHFPPAFNGVIPPRYLDTESEVIGVPERFPTLPGMPLRLDSDVGRGMVHFNAIFQHAFKTPTVRNVELTGPYMHNGGMETLEAVVEFYNAGGGQGLGLDVPNQTLPPDSLGLTPAEISDIVAFMKALTDTTAAGHGEMTGY